MYSRRQLLAGMGMGGAVLLAGCTGSEDSDDNGPDGGTEPGPGGGAGGSTGDLLGRTPTRLLTPDGRAGDQFGSSRALSEDGTVALVGAPRAGTGNEPNSGAAYVYEYDGSVWQLGATLRAGDGDGNDLFAVSVALSGDGRLALVGAMDDEEPNGSEQVGPSNGGTSFGAGSAYVFERTGDEWVERAKLAASDGEGGDRFGSGVALSTDGTTAVVTAQTANSGRDQDGSRLLGAAYVFERGRDEWVEDAKLTAPGSHAFVRVTMSADGTTVGVADPFAVHNDGRGRAYVFHRGDGGWVREGILEPGGKGEAFPVVSTVALSRTGDTALVGFPEEDSTEFENAGAVYVYERGDGTWPLATTLFAQDPLENQSFGRTVAMSSDGTRALVGARFRVFVLERSTDGWRQVGQVVGDENRDADFGPAVLSGDGGTALIAADAVDEGSNETSGVVYIYGPRGG